MQKKSTIMWGIVLIGLGIIIGLNSFGITDINIFFDGWWTLFIIIPSFINLFDEKEGIIWNAICLVIGLALLMGAQGFIPIEIIFKLIIPFTFIIIGSSMIFKNTWKNAINEKISKTNINGLENIVATFSEQKRIVDNEDFEGANLDSVFGGITLDLREANLKNETIIKASAIFGGISIIIPKDATVKIKQTAMFGGVSNDTKNNPDKKIIYIDAFCLFGGLDIK